MAKIPVALLVEHPENKLFHNLSDEELQELAKDMQENGLIHAVVARTAGEQYQIISGHQRVRAAKLLGWTEIETDVLEVDENKAARMLISANVKTRTLSPMELAKAIRRERELIEQTYGNRERKRTDLTAAPGEQQLKGLWSEQVSQEIGKSEQHIRRLDKLNELIPEFQQLVEQGKLALKAGEQLAYLEPETQQALFASLGEEISLRTVAQTKELRKRLEEAQAKDRQTEELQQELARLQQMGRLEDKQQIARLQSEIQRLQNQPPEQIEVVPEAVKNELAVWKKRISEMELENQKKQEEADKIKLELELKKKGYDFLLDENKKLENEIKRLRNGISKIPNAEDSEKQKIVEEEVQFMQNLEKQRIINQSIIKFVPEIAKVDTEEKLAETIQAMLEVYHNRETRERVIVNMKQTVWVLNQILEALKNSQKRLEVLR